MQTIAITIDEPTLRRIDSLVAKGLSKSRSEAVRTALHELLAAIEKREREDREAAVLRKHRRKLSKQTRALVRAQAR